MTALDMAMRFDHHHYCVVILKSRVYCVLWLCSTAVTTVFWWLMYDMHMHQDGHQRGRQVEGQWQNITRRTTIYGDMLCVTVSSMFLCEIGLCVWFVRPVSCVIVRMCVCRRSHVFVQCQREWCRVLASPPSERSRPCGSQSIMAESQRALLSFFRHYPGLTKYIGGWIASYVGSNRCSIQPHLIGRHVLACDG